MNERLWSVVPNTVSRGAVSNLPSASCRWRRRRTRAAFNYTGKSGLSPRSRPPAPTQKPLMSQFPVGQMAETRPSMVWLPPTGIVGAFFLIFILLATWSVAAVFLNAVPTVSRAARGAHRYLRALAKTRKWSFIIVVLRFPSEPERAGRSRLAFCRCACSVRLLSLSVFSLEVYEKIVGHDLKLHPTTGEWMDCFRKNNRTIDR